MSQTKHPRFSPDAMEGMAREVMAAFSAVPKRGAEAGGLLLGEELSGEIQVRDFEPVLCSYRFGPSFVLDEPDHRGLEESLAFFGEAADALPVVGFYRSNTRPDAAPEPRDQELLSRYFPDRSILYVVLQPSRNRSIHADLWKWTAGRFEPLDTGLPFPLREDGEATVSAAPAVAIEKIESDIPAPGQALVPPAAGDPIAPIAAEVLQKPAPRSTWLLRVAACFLTLAGAYLGFRSARSISAQANEPPLTPPLVAQTMPVVIRLPDVSPVRLPDAEPATPPESEPVEESEPEVSESADRSGEDADTAIRQLLEDWAKANRTGEPEEVSALYASEVKRYLGRTGLSQEDVSNSVTASIGRRGVPVIFRISDLKIAQNGDNQATATFRRHWQTIGSRMFAGEEQCRLSLAQADGEWKITAEDELRVYWVHSLK